MNRSLLLAPLFLTLAALVGSAGDRPANYVRVELLLPRLVNTGALKFDKHPGLKEALESVPTAKPKDFLFGFGFRIPNKEHVKGFFTIVDYDPAKADVGQFGKALTPLASSEDRKKYPVAILLVRLDPKIEWVEKLDAIHKALDAVKGVRGEQTRLYVESNILGIVLDESGTAKLREIHAAVESAGGKLQQIR